MMEGSGYELEREGISQDNMQCSVVNRRPQYAPAEREAVKARIEKQLFAVFRQHRR